MINNTESTSNQFIATSPLQAINYLKQAKQNPLITEELVNAALNYLEPYFGNQLTLNAEDKRQIRNKIFSLLPTWEDALQ